MPFSFALPTTSSVLLSECFESVTHPALPLSATTRRSVVKDALKKHKRLSPQARVTNILAVQEALTSYIPYLLALDSGCGYRDVGPENVDVEVKKPLEVEWRSTLSATLPGREAPRPKLTGLHHEIAFTLSTMAYVQSLLARFQLRTIYGSDVLSTEQRTANIVAAMKHLLEAHSIHTYLVNLPSISAANDAPVDIRSSTVAALASLALAEATIIVVAKDDPWTAAVADVRNDNNTDWMFKAPDIPQKRIQIFPRLCLAAAEHAANAVGLFAHDSTKSTDEDLVQYAKDLRRTARGKAARFFGIDAEMSGKTGEALAWLKGARKELGLTVDLEDGKRKGFRGLKQSWQERREDRKVEKGGEWGLDGGRYEEARVVEMLEAKWDRENSTMNVQLVPPFEPLLAGVPSGREYHIPKAWIPPALSSDVLMRMRAPPTPGEKAFRGDEDDSGGEDGYAREEPVGAFPGTGNDYNRSAHSSTYF